MSARERFEQGVQGLLDEFARVYPDMQRDFVIDLAKLGETYVQDCRMENGG